LTELKWVGRQTTLGSVYGKVLWMYETVTREVLVVVGTESARENVGRKVIATANSLFVCGQVRAAEVCGETGRSERHVL
jgi:hypothetical protein